MAANTRRALLYFAIWVSSSVLADPYRVPTLGSQKRDGVSALGALPLLRMLRLRRCWSPFTEWSCICRWLYTICIAIGVLRASNSTCGEHEA